MFYFDSLSYTTVDDCTVIIFKVKARVLSSVQRSLSFLKSKAFIVAVMAQEVQQRQSGTSSCSQLSYMRLLLLLQRRYDNYQL